MFRRVGFGGDYISNSGQNIMFYSNAETRTGKRKDMTINSENISFSLDSSYTRSGVPIKSSLNMNNYTD
jgi:hypothetical protein